MIAWRADGFRAALYCEIVGRWAEFWGALVPGPGFRIEIWVVGGGN